MGDRGGCCARVRRVWCQPQVVALAHEKHTHQGIAQSGVKGFAGLWGLGLQVWGQQQQGQVPFNTG